MAELKVGLQGTVKAVVGDSDLASALGSGDVPVLGTPRMIALAEAATVAAIAGTLDPDKTSVGIHVDMRHIAPSPKGRTVAATAELTRLEGRQLTFRIEVHDDNGLVGDGVVERAIVSRAKFTG